MNAQVGDEDDMQARSGAGPYLYSSLRGCGATDSVAQLVETIQYEYLSVDTGGYFQATAVEFLGAQVASLGCAC